MAANPTVVVDITPPNMVTTAPDIFDEHLVPNLVPQALAPLFVPMLRRHRVADPLAQALRARYNQGPHIAQHPGEATTQEQQQERVSISLRTVHNPNSNGLRPDGPLNLAINEVVDEKGRSTNRRASTKWRVSLAGLSEPAASSHSLASENSKPSQ